MNARLKTAGDDKRGLRCEFNYTIDVSALLTDHPGVFGAAHGSFYQQVIEPLGQLTAMEEVGAGLLDYMVCVPGDIFPHLHIYTSLFIQFMLKEIMNKAVFEGPSCYPGTTDWVAAHERILAFQYSGNPCSLMKFGDIFGLIASLRRKEMPTYTKGVHWSDARGFFIDYKNWPIENMSIISTAAKSVSWTFNAGLAKVSHVLEIGHESTMQEPFLTLIYRHYLSWRMRKFIMRGNHPSWRRTKSSATALQESTN